MAKIPQYDAVWGGSNWVPVSLGDKEVSREEMINHDNLLLMAVGLPITVEVKL